MERLALLGLLNFLCIPHFGWSPELNAVVKVLRSCVHDGYFWLNRKIDFNVDAIHCITGLRKVVANPSMHFIGNNLDQKLGTKLTKKFNLSKGTKAYDVANIQDQTLRFTVQLLAGWVLRKCLPNEVPSGAIDLTSQDKEGHGYNWCLYLLNQFMEDCTTVQEQN